jgi:ABC-type transport system substrate-binding protein
MTLDADRKLFDGLYRYDQRFTPIPNLATCDVADAGVRITCRLRDARFHDGTSVTADDVAYIFQLAASEGCPFDAGAGRCLNTILESARTIDEKTVDFLLQAAHAPFLSLWLPGVRIQPRRQIETDVAAIVEASSAVPLAEIERMTERFIAVFEGGGDCDEPIADATALVQRLGFVPDDRREHAIGRDGAFDPCSYAGSLASQVFAVWDSRDLTGIERAARLYEVLPLRRAPIGTGPWRLAAYEPGVRLVLEEFPDRFDGPPATRRLEYVFVRDVDAAARALAASEVDIARLPPESDPEIPRSLALVDGLKFASYPTLASASLHYNVRPGRLFADRNLRHAVAQCIDKPHIVEAATEGEGIPLESAIPAGLWASADLPATTRDVASGRDLIEQSGWEVGSDGIYEKDGRRLSVEVPVRNDARARVRFVELMALQALDCGMELHPRPLDFERSLLPMANEYPHVLPGTDQPFDAYFGGTGLSPDPDLFDLFHSSEITAPDKVGPNFGGYANADVDKLLEASRTTYDVAERTRIIRQLQVALADDHPALFGYTFRSRVAMDARIETVAGGELDLSAPLWDWQFERIGLVQPR